jgi:2'-hydroxyisoflavone reductase
MKMNILVIGGTMFVGRHIVQSALNRGHEVTLFNRGKTNSELFPDVEKLLGDRTTDLDTLRGRTWDAVVDTCGYVPRVVQKSVDALKSACNQYVYISSGSVYKDKSKKGISEKDEVLVPRDFDAEEMIDETYGELKAGCETVVRKAFAEKSLIIRPGLVVGPDDSTDRFTYWPVRVASGGKIIAPGQPDRQVQFIDVRDLADFTIISMEGKTDGVYNAIGPDYPLTMSQLLAECKRVSASNAEFIWISDEELLSRGVGQWMDFPLWIREGGEESGFLYRDNSKGIAAGLKFRPLSETVNDTLQWWQRERLGSDLRAGVSREREAELLEQHAQAQA